MSEIKKSISNKLTYTSTASDFYVRALENGRREYFYKKKKAKEVLIKSKKAKTYEGYFLILQDLSMCTDWLVAFDKIASEGVFPSNADQASLHSVGRRNSHSKTAFAYFVAFVTTYGKCFTEARGRKTRLQLKDIAEVWHPTHKKLMQYRNEFAAHSGEKDFQETSTKILFGPPHGKHGIPFAITVDCRFQNLPTLSEKRDGLAIVAHLKEIVADKLARLEHSIIDDISKQGIEYWSKKAR